MKKLEQEDFSVIAVTHDEEIIKELNWKTVRFFERHGYTVVQDTEKRNIVLMILFG